LRFVGLEQVSSQAEPRDADTRRVIVEPRLRPRRLAEAVPARLGVRAWLGCLMLGSFLVRGLVAGSVRTPSYFPDEYIYTALSRSLATTGRPLVRGESAHFPALLEPLLAAPLWLVGSTATAYRLVQFENALFMSLAAVPIYLLARRLGLGSRYALASAAFALALPELVFSSFVLTDPLAYPLVFSTLYLGVIALQAPSRRHQLGFVALAGLTTFTRLQYVVLAVAFIAAAFLLDRRAAWRLHRLPLALFGAAGLAGVALGPNRVLGFYDGVDFTHFGSSFARWAVLDLLFLALAGGAAMVPGAVLGLRGCRDRGERAFAFLVVPFALALMVEAAIYAGDGSDRFKERYLFMMLPLLPIAFGLYQKRHRPGRSAVAVLALAIAIGATLLPLASYARGEGFDDSPFLGAYLELQWLVGSHPAGVLVACLAWLGAILAIVASRVEWGAWPVLAWSLALAVVLSVGATRLEARVSYKSMAFVAPNPSWVDAAHVGPVAAIETDDSPPVALTEQLFWNTSITREVLAGSNSEATDPLSVDSLSIAGNGGLFVVSPGTSPQDPESAAPLETAFMFQGLAVSARFVNAVEVAHFRSFSLWRLTGLPRLRVYEPGRYADGWLATHGGLEVWTAGTRGGTLTFTLSLPRTRARDVTIRFGANHYRLTPGERLHVRLRIAGTGRWLRIFAVSSGARRLDSGRLVGVRSTLPIFVPAPARPGCAADVTRSRLDRVAEPCR
jgi:Dolichyl-phosphate-mannose-protein mannosyltransferase